MKINKSSAVLFTIFGIVFLLFACNKFEESAKQFGENQKFNGIWQITSFQTYDSTITDFDYLPFIKFEGNTFVISLNDKIIQRGTFKIDVKQAENSAVFKVVSGSENWVAPNAIYEFKDSSLTLKFSDKLIKDGFVIKKGSKDFIEKLLKVE